VGIEARVAGPSLSSPTPGELVQNASLGRPAPTGYPPASSTWPARTRAPGAAAPRRTPARTPGGRVGWTSGDRKLVTGRTPAAAPPPSPATYRAGVWYQSAGRAGVRQLNLPVFHRFLVYWATGPAVPVSGSWCGRPTACARRSQRRHRFQLRPGLVGAGTLLTDDHPLRRRHEWPPPRPAGQTAPALPAAQLTELVVALAGLTRCWRSPSDTRRR
jgi:hypothetical protein